MYVEADFLLSAKDYVTDSGRRFDGDRAAQQRRDHREGAARSRCGPTTARRGPRFGPTARTWRDGSGLFAVGTPVQATLYLKNDGFVTDVTNNVTGLPRDGRVRRRSLTGLSVIAGLALATACTSATAAVDAGRSVASSIGDGGCSTPPRSLWTAAEPGKADLSAVSHRTIAKVAPTRLAAGLVPPTNRWFSGLVFGDQPQPVFPMPLSIALTDSGIGVGCRRSPPPPRRSSAASTRRSRSRWVPSG